MTEREMLSLLDEIKEAQKDGVSQSHEKYWSKMHLLAEAQYIPAFAFFLKCLDDPRADWREDCLTCLGFHYPLLADGQAVAKIRHLLLSDVDAFVRLAAAAVLGSRSRSLDPALITALEADNDEDVRYAAFAALLKLSGVPTLMVRQEVERVRIRGFNPSLTDVEQISTRIATPLP